ncbi:MULTISPECIES: bifunctional [glutamine synthetase] adenylyltransferase/[glutamine synthetase]-adenylyl-L-tyrosine phosphorylase [unclassified Mycolicibacterium]|uniref:bifunctional [glutamine synthetase] adenylyltransferase/[glutamine synthetase]-adenylyl-L-tyrosine phosphorylase n=1 Tax=unclassified Mycolicibacterium TaxID=2636767 RepID=UPI001306E436|nr:MULTISPECIES: bifunctional [glutamine synthetase] adenylyltransferase/[glutamine synthetase]-adenylyl-L-tyrosine phosphorylase [unclassified Mycolicibacterium]MUL82364.1 bifunctional [glutamine synthetase] adenylyltransferase/[glutamine synthetase]-adenylyl-L-tyrosine phosphorylase [Mycolicibacterium sp. CBMA 329]MUL91504.1 bifunctional [glutamine synthetase] adenylyltransferase/[glutamine synthetase]-adenylyl-L-tyrosine phosphorylase [Mycolicibacterium sp. CBMA 331]MUM02982.1 bifunctional [g
MNVPKPATDRPKLPSVGRLGLVHPRASAELDRLGWNTEGHVELLWSLSRAPDADIALVAMVRLADALGAGADELNRQLLADRTLRGRLFGVLGSSLALGDHLVAHPESWRLLGGDLELPTADKLRAAFTAAARGVEIDRGASSAVPALRDLYRDRLLALAALDVASTVENEPVLPFVEVAAHLSDLADAALGAALTVATRVVCEDGIEPRLAVIAMGKCGARELNYVSDVDVIFVGEPIAEGSGDGNLATASRVAGEMMRFAADAFFEVDAALRPEGKRGQLVRTLESHIAYYQRWAKTWEFQALLKARPAAGDPELGQAYIDALMPMVWTACEREDFVPEVQAMRRRVEELVPAGVRARELKLGTGGLRDVEFAVQLLQLVHGRNDDSLHVASTVDALAALGEGGYVGRDDTANMTASYEFLRLLEHRLQLQRLKRTHMLPDDNDDEAYRWLARAAHVRPDGRYDAQGVLREELKRQSMRVSRLHAKLFYQPLLESVGQPAVGIDAGMSTEAAERQLAALGYEGPQSALTHLAVLTGQSGRRGRVQQVLLPTLLDWLSDTPDPDTGLLAYRRISEELAEQRWYLSTLRDEGAVAKRLMRVLGTSAYIPELLMRAPEVIQLYADGPNGPKLLDGDPDSVARALVASAARHPDPVRGIAAARTLRRRELARIASADVLGLLNVTDVCKALTSVWVAVLQAALDAVIRANTPESGAPARIAVIGMGRLGGGELGYGSDADVMFVCEPNTGVDESAAVRWSVSIAEQVRALLGTPSADPPLEVDAGLRPEGRNGPLVRTLASYAAYYEQWAQPWEIQALLRAHRVAGDLELGDRFLLMADKTRYPSGGVSAEAVQEIRRIKARVDAERLPRGADPNTHTKLGRGGLVDIEWTVQLLQLRHAHELPALHNTSTLETLAAIGAAELVAESDVELLREAWLTATRARNALVLVRGKPTDQLPGPGRQLNAVALAAGWGSDDGGEFLDNYLRVTRRAKGVIRKVFGG